jgi:uncharacterized protein (TIGR00369 family)
MKNWEDDRYCLACGEKNPIGMHLNFEVKDDGLYTSYIFPKEFQGYKDTVHGGMISLLLDEIMVNLPWKKFGVPVVSAEIKVKLKKPLAIGHKVTARAFVEKENRKFYIISSEIFKDEDKELIATAESVCVKI